MSDDPLILDTDVFSNRDFLEELKTYHGEKIIPSVAYAELSVHYIFNKNKSAEEVRDFLRKFHITIENLDARVVNNGVLCCQDANDFKTHSRDYLIGAHAYPNPRIMITNNLAHFKFLDDVGIRVYTSYQYREILEKRRKRR